MGFEDDTCRRCHRRCFRVNAEIVDPCVIYPPGPINGKEIEFAWVIERHPQSTDRILYFSGIGDGWSYSDKDAVRFSRKEDAEKMVAAVDYRATARVADHEWIK